MQFQMPVKAQNSKNSILFCHVDSWSTYVEKYLKFSKDN